MFHTVPEEWKPSLRAYLRQQFGEERDQLHAGDFSAQQSVIIRFPDRSQVLFRYAFAIFSETGHGVAVFTEYCGYHVFPVGQSEVEVVREVPWEPETVDRSVLGFQISSHVASVALEHKDVFGVRANPEPD